MRVAEEKSCSKGWAGLMKLSFSIRKRGGYFKCVVGLLENSLFCQGLLTVIYETAKSIRMENDIGPRKEKDYGL